MINPFTVGIDRLQEEWGQLRPPGCYWITGEREEDGRRLVRQAVIAQQVITASQSITVPQPQAVALIGLRGGVRALLEPPPPGGPEKIVLYSLPDNAAGVKSLAEDLARVLTPKPRLLLLHTSVNQWRSFDSAALARWLTAMTTLLRQLQSALLVITAGPGAHQLHALLQDKFRLLDGLSRLERQQNSWHYRIDWWCGNGRLFAERGFWLTHNQERFAVADDGEQREPATLNDERIYLAEHSALDGAPAFSSQWRLFDNQDALYQAALQASAATVVFGLPDSGQLLALARRLHQLRRLRGAGLKLVVREMQSSLRHSDERLLMACGLNAIVPFGASLSTLLNTLEGLQGQRYRRHVPEDFSTLQSGLQPLQARGYVPRARFCQLVTTLVENPALPENDKGVLVALRPVPQLRPEQALTLCKPRRFGDLATLAGDRLYLFLFACHFTDLDTALKSIFRLPFDEVFSNRLAWHEDQPMLAEIGLLASRTDAEVIPAEPQEVASPAARKRRVPQSLTLIAGQLEEEP